MFRKTVLLLFVLLTSINTFSQSESAVSTLMVPVSPKSAGAGGTGTANIQSDPFGYWSNPAYLGYTSKTSFAEAGFYPGVMDWGDLDGFTVNSYTISAGYNLQKQYSWLPVSIGAAYSNWQFNWGNEFGFYYGAKDKFKSYSFSLGYHSIVNVSAGLTVKSINSILEDSPQRKIGLDATAFDYGILINLPLNNFLCEPLKFSINDDNTVITNFNYNIGYTIQNVGDEVYFADPAQKDPLPRTARLAHNINLGFQFHSEDIDIELLSFSYSIDAIDNLVQKQWDSLGEKVNLDYQGMFGAIKPLKNLFLGERNEGVQLRKGLELCLGEVLALSWGGFDGIKTSGYTLQLKGLLKTVNLFFDSSIISQLSDKVDIKYFSSNYFKDTVLETDYKSIAITISGF